MNWKDLLFGGWTPIWRTLVIGVLAYFALVILLRISGKRTLSKYNAFDFVVTVAFGSTLATVLVNQSVSLAQGVAAFVVLLGMQFVITWVSVRSAPVRELVKGEPALLFHRGRFLDGAMRRERITREELLAAARSEGIASMEDVEAAVLETDGTVTVVRSEPDADPSALRGVRGYDRRNAEE